MDPTKIEIYSNEYLWLKSESDFLAFDTPCPYPLHSGSAKIADISNINHTNAQPHNPIFFKPIIAILQYSYYFLSSFTE